jgi:sugar lactone lactonase YvrE
MDANWQVIGETRDRLGESALWHPQENALYWIDFYGPTIRRYDPAVGETRHWTLDGFTAIGSLAFTADGRLALALNDGVYLFDTASGHLALFADPNAGRPGLCYNDAKVDRDGRYWVGNYEVTEREPRAIFWRLACDGTPTVGDSGFVVCNGPAFSPAGDLLYFSDSIRRRILVYDVARKSGRLSAPRLFRQLGESEGMPDGLCVDSSGAVYCACYGGSAVIRMSAGGERLEAFALPVRNVTSCCLGGPALDTLYVTTAEDGGRHPLDGALFARRVAVAGLPEPLYTIRAADEALP